MSPPPPLDPAYAARPLHAGPRARVGLPIHGRVANAGEVPVTPRRAARREGPLACDSRDEKKGVMPLPLAAGFGARVRTIAQYPAP